MTVGRSLDLPQCATHEEWEVVLANRKTARPWTFFWHWTFPVWVNVRRTQVRHWWWSLVNRTKRQYAVFPRTLNRWHRHDPDTRLLHAAFQCLVDYVEAEGGREALVAGLASDQEALDSDGCQCCCCPPEEAEKCPARTSIKLQMKRTSECLDLYDWWTSRGSKAALREGDSKTWYRETNKLERERQRNLIRLVKVRPGMWT